MGAPRQPVLGYPNRSQAVVALGRQGRSVPEIAAALGCTTNAVHIALTRARKRLDAAARDRRQDRRCTVLMTAEVAERLTAAAERRKLTPRALAERLLDAVLGDGLVDAVLDDAPEGGGA